MGKLLNLRRLEAQVRTKTKSIAAAFLLFPVLNLRLLR